LIHSLLKLQAKWSIFNIILYVLSQHGFFQNSLPLSVLGSSSLG